MVALAAAMQTEGAERRQDAQHTRVVRGGLPWPAVRGERLLRAFAPAANPQVDAHLSVAKSVDDDIAPYEIELCVPTAGHVAMVLVRRTAASATPSTVTRSNTLPANATGNTTSTPAPARVVYVLDAVPPSPKLTAEEAKRGAKGKKSKPVVHQPVDELELLEELFAPSSRAGAGKDGSVLAKAPLLCARFECRVVSIRFIRSGGGGHAQQPPAKRMSSSGKRLSASTSSLSSSSSSATPSARVSSATAMTTPLRCMVAREDGMAFLWEWQADLHQWIFLNSFCFLENPNLKWTKPVAAFTAIDMPFSTSLASSQASGASAEPSGAGGSPSGATELAWWSTAAKSEPKLCLRVLRFERATDALRATDVVVGSAFAPKLPCADVSCLLSSKLGLFAISQSAGVLFRSAAASLRTVVLSWDVILPTTDADTDAAVADACHLTPCMHNVTGELVLLHRDTGAVYVVTPKARRVAAKASSCCNEDHDSCGALFARQVTSLTPWEQLNSAEAKDDKRRELEVLDVAAHRHTLVVLTRHELRVFQLVTGALLDVVPLPESELRSPSDLKLWTVSGSASAVGLWSPSGLWTIRTPAASAVGIAMRDQQQSQASQASPSGANAAFQAVKDYGAGDLQLDAAKYALETLERAMPPAMDPTQHHLEAWEAVEHAVSSPALLLALLEDRATPERFVHELGRLVAALYSTSQRIRVSGRLLGSTGGATDSDSELPRLTPANVELLHHLANWIVLAKRKLARLEACKDASGGSHVSARATERPRAASALTRVLANEDDLSVYGVTASSPTLARSPRAARARNNSVVDPEDTRNFRLSRKLRPMSSLRFAAGCSSSSGRQGRQWLAQLEALLLGAVDFKREGGQPSLAAGTTPSHLLFHDERVLADFRHVAASSFSKHMYLESMSRLYLLYEPQSLLPFVRCVERFCPRLFSLSGHRSVARSQAERAMTLFPPIQLFADRIQAEDAAADDQDAATASLLAYVDLLSYCGRHTEACSALLCCNLYEESKQKLLLMLEPPQDGQQTQLDEADEAAQARTSATEGIYFALLDYCVRQRDAADLQALLALKPTHVDVLHVLRALHAALPASNGQAGGGRAATSGVTVGDLRPVLLTLMQQRRTAASVPAK